MTEFVHLTGSPEAIAKAERAIKLAPYLEAAVADVEFLVRQLHLLEHLQDHSKISEIAGRYGIDPYS